MLSLIFLRCSPWEDHSYMVFDDNEVKRLLLAECAIPRMSGMGVSVIELL